MIFFFRVSCARNTESIPSRDSKMSRASTAISYFKYVKIVSILTIRSTLEIKWTHPLASLNREKPGLFFFSFSVHARFPETTGTRQKFVMFFILFNGGRFSGVEVDESNTVDNPIVPFNIQHNTHWECRDSTISSRFRFTIPVLGRSRSVRRRCEPLHPIQRVVTGRRVDVFNWTINSTINWHWIGIFK